MRNRAFAARRRARAPPMKRPFWNKVPRTELLRTPRVTLGYGVATAKGAMPSSS
jgi:hypothetical protein